MEVSGTGRLQIGASLEIGSESRSDGRVIHSIMKRFSANGHLSKLLRFLLCETAGKAQLWRLWRRIWFRFRCFVVGIDVVRFWWHTEQRGPPVSGGGISPAIGIWNPVTGSGTRLNWYHCWSHFWELLRYFLFLLKTVWFVGRVWDCPKPLCFYSVFNGEKDKNVHVAFSLGLFLTRFFNCFLTIMTLRVVDVATRFIGPIGLGLFMTNCMQRQRTWTIEIAMCILEFVFFSKGRWKIWTVTVMKMGMVEFNATCLSLNFECC